MALLWRTPGPRTGPGPKPGLSVDAIVAAAIAVADTDGLAGLSMRAVAERLGVTAMALYTYVPGKEELVDLMYDGAHAELPVHYDLGKGWRAAVTSWASNLLGCYLRHPWTLQVSFARPVLGPNEQTVLEALARVLRQAGLPAEVARRVVSLLFSVVRGTAQTVAESRQASAAGGAAEQAWWSSRAAARRHVAPATPPPRLRPALPRLGLAGRRRHHPPPGRPQPLPGARGDGGVHHWAHRAARRHRDGHGPRPALSHRRPQGTSVAPGASTMAKSSMRAGPASANDDEDHRDLAHRRM
jgi:AcrR family transcriptional regulator